VKPTPLPPFEYLKMRFAISSFSPSGLIWKKPHPQAKKLKPGDIAGSLCSDGYWQLKLTYNKKQYHCQVHRIIYSIGYKENIDNYLIDHIKGKENFLQNLRKACPTTNSYNQKLKATNKRTSKYKGVSFCKNKKGTKKWRATIQYDKKRFQLGYFYTEKEAAIAYNKAASVYHKEFAYLNNIND
jgi:hypothetical protein